MQIKHLSILILSLSIVFTAKAQRNMELPNNEFDHWYDNNLSPI
jgi:hypothetical protein